METKVRVFLGFAAWLLCFAVPSVTVHAEEEGRNVPRYDLGALEGDYWDEEQEQYYLPDGTIARDAWFFDGTHTYYLMYDGTPMKDRLSYHPNGKEVIYLDAKGHEVFDDFANVKMSIAGEPVDDLCFFNSLGYLYVDVLTYGSKNRGTETELYYANPYGVMECDGWFQFSENVSTPWGNNEGVAGGRGYANTDGTLAANEYIPDENGNLVYMEGAGYMRDDRDYFERIEQ